MGVLEYIAPHGLPTGCMPLLALSATGLAREPLLAAGRGEKVVRADCETLHFVKAGPAEASRANDPGAPDTVPPIDPLPQHPEKVLGKALMASGFNVVETAGPCTRDSDVEDFPGSGK